jgi:hypothetical protein
MTSIFKIFLTERKSLGLILVVLLNFHFVSCKNECDNFKPNNIYNNIKQGFLNLAPYKGFDTLTFIRNESDTIKFYGSGKIRSEAIENGDLGGCGPTEILHNESFRYNYKSYGPYNSIVIIINYPEDFYCYFRNKTFKIPMSSLYAPFDMAEMEVNGKVYKDINYIPRQPIDTLYYDNENGMIKFGFQNGEQWTLVKN